MMQKPRQRTECRRNLLASQFPVIAKHLITILAVAACGQAFAAQTFAEASAFISGLPPDTDTKEGGGAIVMTRAEVQASSPFGVTASALATANTSAGSIKVFGQSSASVGTNVQAGGTGQWSDAFIIHATGLAGTIGTISGNVDVGGSLSAEYLGTTNQAAATTIAVLSVGTDTDGGFFRAQGGGRRVVGAGIDITEGLENFSLKFIDLPFTFGKPINVTLRLLVNTGVDTAGKFVSASATANYNHTMTWSGLSQVSDATGTFLTDFTAISPDTGFNFALAVPEPSTTLLLLLGIGATPIARRLKNDQ